MRTPVISISEAARLTRKSRNKIISAVRDLPYKLGPKNAKFYLASELLQNVYLGYSTLAYGQERNEIKRQEANGFEWPEDKEKKALPDERVPEDVQ